MGIFDELQREKIRPVKRGVHKAIVKTRERFVSPEAMRGGKIKAGQKREVERRERERKSEELKEKTQYLRTQAAYRKSQQSGKRKPNPVFGSIVRGGKEKERNMVQGYIK